MLVILIEILTEIPLQKQHIMRRLNTHNIRSSIHKRSHKKLQASSKVKDSFKHGDLKLSLKLQCA